MELGESSDENRFSMLEEHKRFLLILELTDSFNALLRDAANIINDDDIEDTTYRETLSRTGLKTKISQHGELQRTAFLDVEDHLIEYQSSLQMCFLRISEYTSEPLHDDIANTLSTLSNASNTLATEKTVLSLAIFSTRLMIALQTSIKPAQLHETPKLTSDIAHEARSNCEEMHLTVRSLCDNLLPSLALAMECVEIFNNAMPDSEHWSRIHYAILSVFMRHHLLDELYPAYGCVIASELLPILSSDLHDSEETSCCTGYLPPSSSPTEQAETTGDSNGYIYALINPSLQGLIKVGKTTRHPKDRAKELSSHTGVPTPYIVAYYKKVGDCNKAERYVHSQLENNGFRVSENREFFNASLADVIDIMLEAETVYAPHKLVHGELEHDPYEETREEALALLARGDELYFGVDESESNHKEARILYKQSAKLGCAEAYYRLGDIFNYAHGVTKNPKQAYIYYSNAVTRGFARANIELAMHHIDQGEFSESFKFWKAYLRELHTYSEYEMTLDIFWYIVACYREKKTPPKLKNLYAIKDHLLEYAQTVITEKSDNPDYKHQLEKVRNLLKQNITEQ